MTAALPHYNFSFTMSKVVVPPAFSSTNTKDADALSTGNLVFVVLVFWFIVASVFHLRFDLFKRALSALALCRGHTGTSGLAL